MPRLCRHVTVCRVDHKTFLVHNWVEIFCLCSRKYFLIASSLQQGRVRIAKRSYDIVLRVFSTGISQSIGKSDLKWTDVWWFRLAAIFEYIFFISSLWCFKKRPRSSHSAAGSIPIQSNTKRFIQSKLPKFIDYFKVKSIRSCIFWINFKTHCFFAHTIEIEKIRNNVVFGKKIYTD